MTLGDHFLCLDVRDIHASIDFYRKLDFTVTDDHTDDGWAMLQHRGFVLCLFQGHIDRNLMNFRGGDIEEIAAVLKERGIELSKGPEVEKDGSWSAEVKDPDGNVIYFNTFPAEREKFLREGGLIRE